MRHFLLLVSASVLTASLGLAACEGDRKVRISSRDGDSHDRGVLRVVNTLQCPETMGDLTRKGSAQAGGTICTYTGPRGAEVTLHLVPLDEDTVAETLEAFETRLKRDLPHTAAGLTTPAPPTPPAPPSPPQPSGGSRTEVVAPGLTVRSEGDTDTVRLPGLRVESSGDKSSVRIGGFRIESDDGADSVNITSNDDSVSIQAHEDAAEIRTSVGGGATRATYILTDGTPSAAGWRLVGYEARGPVGGPLVIATVRSKDRDQDAVFDDAKDLVTLNVGE